MDNLRKITSKEIQNAVLGETKQVLEILEESKEKVSNLQQNLKHNEDLFEQLENSIKIRKDTSNDNWTIIESNETFKHNVKEFHRKFLSFAQLIYSCGQEFFKEQNFRDSQLDKVEEMVGKTEETYNLKVEYYDSQEKQLFEELRKINEKNCENDRILLTKEQENKELNDRLNNLNREIVFNQKQNDDKILDIEQETAKCQTELDLLAKELAPIEHELSNTLHALEDIHEKKTSSKELVEESLIDMEKMILERQNELTHNIKQIEELTNLRNELSNHISTAESSIKLSEEEILQINIKLKDAELKLKKVEQSYLDEIDAHQDFITSYEHKLIDEKKLNRELSEELKSWESRFKKLLEDIDDIKKYLDATKARPEVDFAQQLEDKQIAVNEAKAIKNKLKEKLKTLAIEQKEKMIKEQEEIANVEKTIKNTEKDINKAESEIGRLKAEEELNIEENLELEKKLIELDREIDNTKEAISAKNDELSFMHPKIVENPPAKSKTFPKNPQSKPRNWDSDSSIEGEDRSYSERARLKVRMMKKGI